MIEGILYTIAGLAAGWTIGELWKINGNLKKIQDILIKIHKDEPL
jgi:hypothetical protein